MTNVIGMRLKGEVANETATFEIINICKDGSDVFIIAECIEFGTPNQRININDINKPVRA